MVMWQVATYNLQLKTDEIKKIGVVIRHNRSSIFQ